MHIFCSNALIFVDFWYVLFFILILLQFINIKKYLKTEKVFFLGLNIIFVNTNLKKKWSKEHQSFPESSKIGAFKQKICICHSPNYYYYCTTFGANSIPAAIIQDREPCSLFLGLP